LWDDREQNKKLTEPMSMYGLFAKMFAHLAKEVTERFGEDGREAIRAGVRNFGEERGRNIAKRAESRGLANVPANYLDNYDMERSGDFDCRNTYGQNQVNQIFTKCAFADKWLEDKMEAYGRLYCESIDPSIASGYNENMECIHDKHIFSDGVCTFCFRLKG